MIELLEANPKAAEKIRSWLIEKMIASIPDNATPEFIEYARSIGVSNERVSEILGSNPRSLFDVFDEHGVYITTSIILEELPTFTYSIMTKEISIGGGPYNTRKEAEKDAVRDAFSILNEKI